MAEQELLDCPFCGATAGDIKLGSGHGYIIGCGMCQGQQFAMSRDEAVKLWNTRAAASDYRRAIEALESMRKPPMILEGDSAIDVAGWFVAEIDKVIALLTTEQVQGVWLPIESAPKDITHKSGGYEYGRNVLVYDGNVTTACWWQCRKKDGDIYGSNWIDNGANALRPSHWMPLPAPPVPVTADEGNR